MTMLSFLFCFLAFFVLGTIWYIADRTKGQLLFRWFYTMTHEKGAVPTETRGFIYNRKTSPRFAVAVVLSTLQVAIMALFLQGEGMFTLFLIWLFGIPALMLGFILGPIFDRFWQKKEAVFDKIDRIESGEDSISDTLSAEAARQMLKTAVKKGADVLKGGGLHSSHDAGPTSGSTSTSSPSSAPTASAPKPENQPPPEIDGRAAIQRFANRGNSKSSE